MNGYLKMLVAAFAASVVVIGLAALPVQAAPISYWAFDEGTGIVANNSVGGGPVADLRNTPAWTTGRFGNAVSYNGTTQYANVVQDISETQNTVSMWIKSTVGGGFFSVNYPELGGANDRNFYLSGGNVYGRIWTEETINTSGINFADGAWHHVVHQYGPTVAHRVYVDGVLRATGAKAQSDFNWQTNLEIGWASVGGYFNGQVDDVAVWNDELSANQVYALANGVAPTNLQSGLGTQALWTDAVGLWENGANWSTNPAVPGPGYDAYVNNTGTAQIGAGVTANPDVLVVGGLGAGTVEVANGGTLSPGNMTVSPGGTLLVYNGNTINVTAGTLHFNGGTLKVGNTNTVVSPNITLDSGGMTVSTQGNYVLLTGSIDGPGGLTMTGANGAVYLYNNSYAGLTTAAQGYLVARHNNALGSTAGATQVLSGATLQFEGGVTISGETAYIVGTGEGGRGAIAGWSGNNTWAGPVVMQGDSRFTAQASTSLTISGPISGTGNLTKMAAGTVTFSGADANTYSGTTTVSEGKLVLGKTAGVNAISGNLVINPSSGWAGAANGVELAANEQIPNSAVITFSGTDWSGLRTKGFTETVAGISSTGGKGVIENAGQGQSVAADGKLIVDNAADYSYDGIIRDNDSTGSSRLSLEKRGAGTLTLKSSNITYTGATTVGGGKLVLEDASAFGSNITDNAAVEIKVSTGQQAFNPSIGGTGTLTKSGAGTLVLYNPMTYGGSTTIAEGTLKLPEATTLSVGGAALWLDATATASLTKDGSGNVTEWRSLIGTDKAIVPAAGREPTLVAGAINGNDAVAFTASTQDALYTATNFPAAVSVFYVGQLTGGANARLLSGVNNNWLLGFWNGYRDQAYFNGWVYQPILATDANVHLYSTVIPGTGQNSTVWSNGVQIVSNQGGVAGPNGLRLGGGYGAGEYSNGQIGELLVYSSALSATDRQAIEHYLAAKWFSNFIPDGSAVSISLGATLDLGGHSETIGSLAGQGNVVLGAGTLTTGGNNAQTQFYGSISGSGGLTKVGSQPFYLEAANTYDGLTTVSGGYLVARHNQALGSTVGGSLVNSGATLQLQRLTPSGADITITGEAVTLNGVGVDGYRGALASWTGNNAWNGPVTLASNSSIYVDADSLSIGGPIDGAYNLLKSGAGTLTLAAANTYGGTTTVGAGTLLVDGSITSPVIVNGGTLGGSGTIAGLVTVNSPGVLDPGNSPGVLTLEEGVTFNGGVFRVQLNGTTPGVGGYDQIVIPDMPGTGDGNVVIGLGTQLDPSLGYAPGPLDYLWIILNEGTGTTSGYFAGMEEGSSVGVGGAPFNIFYHANFATGSTTGGNDVLLTTAPEPSAIVALLGLAAMGLAGYLRRRRS